MRRSWDGPGTRFYRGLSYDIIGGIVWQNWEHLKEEFKKQVKDYVKVVSRKTIEEASDLDIYTGVAYGLKDVIIDQWIATHKEYEKKDAKTVYYLSMEFLTGRALGNLLSIYPPARKSKKRLKN